MPEKADLVLEAPVHVEDSSRKLPPCHPKAALDNLECAEHGKLRRMLAGILSLQTPLNMDAFAELMCTAVDDPRDTFDGLHSIANLPGNSKSGELRKLHASPDDFHAPARIPPVAH